MTEASSQSKTSNVFSVSNHFRSAQSNSKKASSIQKDQTFEAMNNRDTKSPACFKDTFGSSIVPETIEEESPQVDTRQEMLGQLTQVSFYYSYC